MGNSFSHGAPADSWSSLAKNRDVLLSAWPQDLPDEVATVLKEHGLRHSEYSVRSFTRELLDEFGHHASDAGLGAAGVWAKGPPLPAKRSGFGAAAADGLIYVAGGSESWHHTRKAARYDPEAKTWEQLPDMPTGRHSLALAALGGCVYALGGYGDSGCQKVAERFVPRSGRSSGVWESLPDMTMDRRSHGATGLRGLVYAVGGHNGGTGAIAHVECFNPLKNAWQEVVPMPTAREGLATAATGGLLYAFGGSPGQGAAIGAVERYSPQSKTWESLPQLPTPRTGLAAAAAGGRIYVLGGCGDNKILTATRRFDPLQNLWEDMPELPEARWQLAAAASDGRIYALGGENEEADPVDEVMAFEP